MIDRFKYKMPKILNLTHNLKFTKNQNIVHKAFTFPGKEEHVKIDSKQQLNRNDRIIIATAGGASDIWRTLLATNAFRRAHFNNLELFCPYIPYARQDRLMNEDLEPLSIEVFADVINLQKYNKVHVLNPHSGVASALIHNINIMDELPFISKCWEKIKNMYTNETPIKIVSPDAGAEKKVEKMAERLNLNKKDIIKASKVRNSDTRELSDCTFMGDVQNSICVIYDDIIDGGGTFINLAKELKSKKAHKVYLIVSHGIFSRGYNLSGLDGVFTTDAFHDANDSKHNRFIDVTHIEDFCNIEEI